MAASTYDLHDAPAPVARPTQLPVILAAVVALAEGGWRFEHSGGTWRGATLVAATVACAFFLGRRLAGAWAGLLLAMTLAAIASALNFHGTLALAIFFAVVGAWWARRFQDDQSVANGLVAVAALLALGWLVTH